jgi:hypothetical protein
VLSFGFFFALCFWVSFFSLLPLSFSVAHSFFFLPAVGYDSLSFYKAKIGGNGRPPKCPVTDPLSAFNAEI